MTGEAERATEYAKSWNHALAVTVTPRWLDRLETLDVPALVVYGTEDPILPFELGEALAKAIRGAKLIPMKGVGHAFPEPVWEAVRRSRRRTPRDHSRRSRG